MLLTGADGGQLSRWAIERGMRRARKKAKGLPAGFRYHDAVIAAYLTEQRRCNTVIEQVRAGVTGQTSK